MINRFALLPLMKVKQAEIVVGVGVVGVALERALEGFRRQSACE